MLRRLQHPVHPGLWLTRFVRWGPVRQGPNQWDFKVVTTTRSGKQKEEDRKRDNLDHAARAANVEPVRKLATEWRARREAWLKPLEQQGLACRFRAKTDWRLAIGLAGASPLETNIVFHRLYGVPMLPGSGLKGLALAVARSNGEHETIFGTQKAAGLVDVLDAIPISPPGKNWIEVDIMNPHYPDWYQQKKDKQGKALAPSDDQSPNPIFFLTVSPGVEFEFALLCRTRTNEAKDALNKAKAWLIEGLKTLGAGAKTAAGYGYFV
ncbi:type III-B CRISPR module RAMP protein Cmr6 [Nitrospira tepida]|nr:type III-B CRISPR module RAMP protein Cmr6 [Nitrospira tepida]